MKLHELRVGPPMVGAGGELKSLFVPFLQREIFYVGFQALLEKTRGEKRKSKSAK